MLRLQPDGQTAGYIVVWALLVARSGRNVDTRSLRPVVSGSIGRLLVDRSRM